MYVEASKARNLQDGRGQNQSVCHHDQDIAIEARQDGLALGSLKRFWLPDGQAFSQCHCLDRRVLQPLAATCGPVGLTDHRHNLVGPVDQAFKMPGSEARGAGENNFERRRHVSGTTLLFFDELAANPLSL